jgi:hypothetical protein
MVWTELGPATCTSNRATECSYRVVLKSQRRKRHPQIRPQGQDRVYHDWRVRILKRGGPSQNQWGAFGSLLDLQVATSLVGATVCPSNPFQWLYERACPGPVDKPHRARLYLLSFIVQNYWSRWSHHRRCFADLRWNGKVYCKPDETWDTPMARGLEDAVSRKIDKEAQIFGPEYGDNDSVMDELPPVPSDISSVCLSIALPISTLRLRRAKRRTPSGRRVGRRACPDVGLDEIDLLADTLRFHFLWMLGLHSMATLEFIRLSFLWMIAGLDYVWQDRPPAPQQKKITIYRRGEAPFHRIDKPSPRETIRLLNLYRRTGDVIARNTVVAGYLDDAMGIARRYRTDNADDLEQDAAEALIEAVEKYAAEHEAAFSTFLYEVVDKRCIDSLRRYRRHKRLVSTESIAEKNEAALGPYAGNPVKPTRELKIFRELFENT